MEEAGLYTFSSAAPEPGSIAVVLSAGVPVAGLVRRRKVARKNEKQV